MGRGTADRGARERPLAGILTLTLTLTLTCERSLACTSIGGAAPHRSRQSAAIEVAVASHSSAGQHSFWMMPMKPSTCLGLGLGLGLGYPSG